MALEKEILQKKIFESLDSKDDKEFLYLLESNPDVDVNTLIKLPGRIPLLNEIIQKNRLSLLKPYFERNGDPNVFTPSEWSDDVGETPLLLAVRNNNVEAVIQLLGKGANGLRMNGDSEFPLKISKNPHISLLLTKHGFNPYLEFFKAAGNAISSNDEQALRTAESIYRRYLGFEMEEQIANLIEPGIYLKEFSDVSFNIAMDKEKIDPNHSFFNAVMDDDFEKANILLSLNLVDPDAIMPNTGGKWSGAELGNMPLIYNLVSSGNIPFAEKLIEQGGDPNLTFKFSMRTSESILTSEHTGLEQAINTGNMEMFHFYLHTAKASPFTGVILSAVHLARTDINDPIKQLMLRELIEVDKKRRLSPTDKDREYLKYRKLRALSIEAGHILGIKTSIPLKYPNGQIYRVETEGNFVYDSAIMINKVTRHYNEQLKQTKENPKAIEYFDKISQAMEVYQRYTSAEGSETPDSLLKIYLEGNPVVLPVGLPQHGLTITLQSNRLIICNRGYGQLETGLTVFEIPDKSKITPNFIKKLTTRENFHTMGDILDALKAQGVDTNQRHSLPSKEQRHGTCSFVNVKSAVHGIIYSLALEDGLEPKAAMELAATEYKKYTANMRDYYLDELLSEFQATTQSSDEESQKVILRLLSEYLLEHHGQKSKRSHDTNPKKRKQEHERAQKILRLISNKGYQKALGDILSESDKMIDLISFSKNIDPEGKLLNFEKYDFQKIYLLFKQAFQENNLELIAYMLQRNDFKNHFKMAFSYAVEEHQFELANVFLKNGYDPYQFDSHGQTALHNTFRLPSARQARGMRYLTPTVNALGMEYLLLKQGLDPEKTNQQGESFIDLISGYTFYASDDPTGIALNKKYAEVYLILCQRPLEEQKKLLSSQLARKINKDYKASRFLSYMILAHIKSGTEKDRALLLFLSENFDKKLLLELIQSSVDRKIFDLHQSIKPIMKYGSTILDVFDEVNPRLHKEEATKEIPKLAATGQEVGSKALLLSGGPDAAPKIEKESQLNQKGKEDVDERGPKFSR